MTTVIQRPQPLTDKIVWYGDPAMSLSFNVTEVTNIGKFIAGRLATPGSSLGSGSGYSDYDAYVSVNPATHRPYGWIGYDDVDTNVRPAYITKAYESSIAGAKVETRLYKGKNFGIMASLYPYMTIKQGRKLCNWYDGQVAGPCLEASAGLFLGIPFSASASSEVNTHVVIPKNIQILPDSFVEVTTQASQTIDVGTLSTETSGDPNGIFAALSTAAAGIVGPLLAGASATTGTETLGALLRAGAPTEFKDASSAYSVLGRFYNVDYSTENAVGRTISYTPSSTGAVAGTIWLHLLHPCLRVVGEAAESVTTTTTATDIAVVSEL